MSLYTTPYWSHATKSDACKFTDLPLKIRSIRFLKLVSIMKWMNFSLHLLIIKSLYTVGALLAHSQEALHKRHLVYCMHIMPVGCAMITVSLKSWDNQLTYACSITSTVCAIPPEDEQVLLETSRGSWFSINWMKSASRWFLYTDILWCTVSKTLSFLNLVTSNHFSLSIYYYRHKMAAEVKKNTIYVFSMDSSKCDVFPPSLLWCGKYLYEYITYTTCADVQ
jgi:hypothetical protein